MQVIPHNLVCAWTFILTHENADFDAVAGLLAAARLYPDAIPVLPERINQMWRDFWHYTVLRFRLYVRQI